MQLSRTNPTSPRGLTLLELMLALTITVLVAGAMSGMMAAVSSGVMDRKDSRSAVIRAAGADAKLDAYINPARAIWAVESDKVAFWLNDTRQGNAIHATEIRWLVYDADEDALDVHFVKFPENWTQSARDLSDNEFAKNTDHELVYTKYLEAGYMASLRLIDGLTGFSISTNDPDALDSTQIVFHLEFEGTEGPIQTTVPVTLGGHNPPAR